MKSGRARAAGALGIAIALLLAGCGGGSGSSGGGGKYVVGFNGGLTGSVSGPAVSLLDGMRAYFEQRNASGGINGHQVEIVARDDTGLDTARATANMIEFRDRVKPSIVAGFTVSSVLAGVIPLAQEAQLPITTTTPTEEFLRNPYVYGTELEFTQNAKVEVEYLKTLLAPGEKPKIALFVAQTAAGKALGDTARLLVKAEGWDLVLDESLPVPAPDDMSPQASRIVSSGATYVIGGIFLQLPALLMRSLTQLGWKGKVVNFYGGSALPLLRQVNNPAYYVVRSNRYTTEDFPEMRKVISEVKKIGGNPDGDQIVTGWVNAAIIASALERCGYPCPGSKMKAAMDSLGNLGTFADLVQGPVTIDASSRQAIRFGRVYHYVNGRVEAVSGALEAPPQ
jgi:branched-chain amino acid transport system substrate-binding protein